MKKVTIKVNENIWKKLVLLKIHHGYRSFDELFEKLMIPVTEEKLQMEVSGNDKNK